VSDTPAFLQLYDDALPHVYGYLARRCTDTATAEDLTADTFMAAITALRKAGTTEQPDLNIAWLIGTARHKLIDHWRRTGRHKEELADLWDDIADPDPNDAAIEVADAHEVLAELAPRHRAVLTLRYLDGLPVGDVATTIGRTVHATEALLTRAKAAFRNHSRSAEERFSR
jgi:RNA polymerase sigma-70 factor, ECF subfamily